MKNLFLLTLLLTVIHACAVKTPPEATTGMVEQEAEVIVLSGLAQTIEWLEAEDWWGEENREEQLTAPHALITSIPSTWKEVSSNIPVETKKEVFYRFILPLIMHANAIVLDRRERFEDMGQQLLAGDALSAEDLQWLAESAVTLRIVASESELTASEDVQALLTAIEECLYKLDVIPAGLALGQAAYESGYGTSRFAAQGNALFGQWDFDGNGIVPLEQRSGLGDYRIASFEWPFDSIRSYFINLSRHPAYEEFRRLRAEMRANGQPLDSLALAAGLVNYSERGQEYVETLRGIIRFNNLTIADDAVFRDEPIRFLVGAENEAEAAELRAQLDVMRTDGSLAAVIQRMDLN